MTAQFQLVMRQGPTPGATFSLEGDQLIIGRDSASGVAINDAEVSRKHARLTFQGGKYVLEDLGSTNGTFVNGQRLANPVVLKSGDVISLGEQIVLMYESLVADLSATVISSSRKNNAPAPSAPAPAPSPARPIAAPSPARPIAAPGPARPVAAPSAVPVQQAPVAPPPAPAYTPIQTKKGTSPFIFIGIALLFFIFLCVAAFWYIDSNFLWCTFFPFLTGCG